MCYRAAGVTCAERAGGGRPLDNPFWQFSLDAYQRDGVQPACLSLQDDWGLDVNVLLYAA